MLESEESSLCAKFMGPIAKALDYAFGCHHEHLSRVFTIEGRSYKVCCDCGKDFDYSLRTMSIVRRRTLAPRLRLLRMRHI
jgi:hypothetical protein